MATPGDFFLGAVFVLLSLPSLVELHLIQVRFQYLHRHLAVAMLGAFVLTLNDSAARDVRYPDRGIGRIDVLAAFAARAERVDTKVFFIDIDLNRFIHLGCNRDRRERRVTPAVGIERRYPDEP